MNIKISFKVERKIKSLLFNLTQKNLAVGINHLGCFNSARHSNMVVFPPACIPRVLNAYPTVPLLPSVQQSVVHDFNVGSFARFQRPTSVISIHDRPDLHALSHLQIRQRLDAEGHENEEIVIIDKDTVTNHAVWFVRSTGDSAHMTEFSFPPPKQYPGETPLYKLHIMTQHLPMEFDFEIGGGKSITENLPEPYDPHDPQIPPYSAGVDYNKKEDAYHNAWYFFPTITASPREYEFSDDPSARHQPQFWAPDPPYVVRLTRQAARIAGLLSEWQAWHDPLPGPGQSIKFDAHYDWDSPKWAWDGTVRENGTALEGSRPRKAAARLVCGLHSNSVGLRLPGSRNGHKLNQSVNAVL